MAQNQLSLTLQTWVFGADMQFHSNGSIVPADLITEHWTAASIVSRHPEHGVKFNTSTMPFRAYIKSLRRAAGTTDQAAVACMLAGFMLHMHQDATDQVGLTLGLTKRPVYVVTTASHTAQVGYIYY